jgi:integrase
VRKHLNTYDKFIDFEKLDDIWFTGYIDYLRKLEMRNISIEEYFRCLKWFLRWSVKKGYNKNMTFASYKPKLKIAPKKVVFLTKKEINQLREFAIPETKNYLERVRDVFLFCCFTGLRHSDVFNLKRSDVKENHIEITTVKTTDNLIIELNDHSKSIQERNKNTVFKDDKALPVITKQRMNYYLKELGELAGINEPVREVYYRGNQRIDEVTPKYALLGTHCGRRTLSCPKYG